MSQLVLFAALHVLGVVVCMAIGPRRIWLCSAIGFAIGLACMVVLSLIALLLGLFRIEVMAALYVVVLGAAAHAARDHWDRKTLISAGCGLAAFVALCAPFCAVNFSAFSYDSHMFVMYGRILGDDGRLSLDMIERLNAWGVFQVVAHAMSAFVREDYLYGLAPAFAVSMLATFAAVLAEALGELRVRPLHRALAIGLAILVLLAIPLFRFHVIYIHSNMGSAGYLLFFVVLFWLGEIKNDASYAPIAMLSLLAFTLLRVEAVPYAIAFLVLTVINSRLPRGVLGRWYLLYTVVLVAWFTLLARSVPADSVYLTPTKCLLFGAALLLLFACWALHELPVVRHVTPYVPYIAVAACVLGIAAAYQTNSANMRESAGIWLDDLWTSPYWASIWKCAALIAVIGVFVPAPPRRTPLVLGIALFFGLTLIVSSTGTAFGGDIDGSLIRMTIHILPIVMFYGVLKFAPLLARER